MKKTIHYMKWLNLVFPLKCIFAKIPYRNKVIFGKNLSIKKTVFCGKNRLYNNVTIWYSHIGEGTYLGSNTQLFKVKIGKFCSIADNVKIGFGSHPTSHLVSTFPSFYYNTNSDYNFSFYLGSVPLYNAYKYVDKKQCYLAEVGNDVWIGSHALIMDGVKIGDGAIIAAGAVVTKNIEPYAIVGGVPAKLIKKRFNDSQIEILLKFKWWEKDFSWLKEHVDLFQDINLFCAKKGTNW